MAQLWKNEAGNAALFDRGDNKSPFIFCKVKNPTTNKWVFFSTQTADLNAAITFAIQKQAEIAVLAKHNVDIGSPTFPKAADIYKERVNKLAGTGKWTTRKIKDVNTEIDRFLSVYFKTKPLNKILNEDIEHYRDWRVNYWLTGPGSLDNGVTYKRAGQTIKTTLTYTKPLSRRSLTNSLYLLKQVLLVAQDKGWIKTLPNFKLPKVSSKKRELEPYFTMAEIEKLYQSLEHWTSKREKRIRELRVNKPEKELHQLMFVRHLIVYVGLVLGSGMRPGTETANLTIGSFNRRGVLAPEEEGVTTHLYEADVDGKTGKRSAIIGYKGSMYVMTWIQLQLSQLPNTDGSTPLFCTPLGQIKETQTASLFRRVLKKYDLLVDAKGRKRTLYSLRNSYATNMIVTKPNMPYAQLAHQMGTSIAMLEKHYVQPLSHILNAHRFVAGF